MFTGFVHFLSTEVFTKVEVAPEVGYGLFTHNTQRMKAINQTVQFMTVKKRLPLH